MISIFSKKNHQRKKNTQQKNTQKKRYSERVLSFFIRPGAFLYDRIPTGTKKTLCSGIFRLFQRQYSGEGEVRRFLEEELAILFWGLVLVLITAITCIFILCRPAQSITFTRNPFGEGAKEQSLLLKDKKGSRSFTLPIGEAVLSEKEKGSLLRKFFLRLRLHMQGENTSLRKVDRPLVFDEELEGYPFHVEYQPEDLSLIGFLGEPGEEAARIKIGQTRTTRIKVTATYGSIEESRVFLVVLTAPKRRKPTVYELAENKLSHMEKTSREKRKVVLPARIGRIRVAIPGLLEKCFAWLLLACVIPAAWIFHRYVRLKEKDAKRKKEEEEDFPIIVHLLTLYMKAGLSFSSAVHRICMDYRGRKETEGRYAFREITIMDKQLGMGVSQKEACAGWGKRSGNILYQRLSAAMIQILVKGSKEGDRILEHMEREAFEQRIDRAREEGKTAQTKLLFPMIILLAMSLLIVLFPAVLQFQGF